MLNNRLPLLLITWLSLAGSLAYGQAARSPFSSFGLGERFTNAVIQQQGMGGVGISNGQFWYINNQNPALLVYNRVTTFQAGMVGEQRVQSGASGSEKSGSGNLAYLALSIPVKTSKWTSSITLMPYTCLNYSFSHVDSIKGTTTNTVNVKESGSGGINQLAWSNGVAITREFSVGLKAAYLFSSVTNEYDHQLVNTNQTIVIFPRIIERTYISDFQFTPAVSLHLDSLFKNKQYRLNVGLVYDFKTNLAAKFYQQLQRLTPVKLVDSVTLINNESGSITVPSNWSAGISFGKGQRWVAALDGSYADYNAYKDLTGANPYKNAAWRVSGGFEITPDPNALGAYLKRMTYRTGVSLENYPYLVNGNTFKDFGITFGVSMPVSRISTLDLALKVGNRGNKSLNGIEENYLKVYFGITFNDQWFIKRRFD